MKTLRFNDNDKARKFAQSLRRNTYAKVSVDANDVNTDASNAEIKAAMLRTKIMPVTQF